MKLMEILKPPIKAVYRFLRKPSRRTVMANLQRQQMQFLSNEVSELRSIVRHLAAESSAYQQYILKTRESFEFQWKNLSEGAHLLSDQSFQEGAVSLLEQYTGLPKDWFINKKVLDAGCGNGRWSWALCTSGAHVTAIDASPSGVEKTREVCSIFPNFTAKQHDLLEKLDMQSQFDLVFSYGVVHHTGNTWLAVQNIAECVCPGGYLFMMIYGEPRPDHVEDYAELNQYAHLRHIFAAMSFDERVSYLNAKEDKETVHGWFDAVSPHINDLYRFDEINAWLHVLGFDNIQLTTQTRNLHLIAQRIG